MKSRTKIIGGIVGLLGLLTYDAGCNMTFRDTEKGHMAITHKYTILDVWSHPKVKSGILVQYFPNETLNNKIFLGMDYFPPNGKLDTTWVEASSWEPNAKPFPKITEAEKEMFQTEYDLVINAPK